MKALRVSGILEIESLQGGLKIILEKELRANYRIDIEDTDKGATARVTEGPIRGALVNLKSYNSSLFDDVIIKISDVDILKPQIMVQEVRKIEKES